MSSTTNTTAQQIWTKLANKEYRDSFVASNISNTVSSQIYTLRDHRGWTQKELAQRAGMGQSRIPTLEDPNLDNFEISTLKRIASAFDVALVVRFVPFSELANWTSDLSEEDLLVPEFAHDGLSPVSANSAQIVHINVTPNFHPTPAPAAWDRHLYPGMTLRDYFAGQSVGQYLKLIHSLGESHGLKDDAQVMETAALKSYQLAEAMLKARDAK